METEVLKKLRDWDYGSAAAERLSAQILRFKGFENINPSHPAGGRDRGKDGTCEAAGKTYIYAVYFPNSQQKFTTTKKKFLDDLDSAKQHSVDGFIFITNQKLTIDQRGELESHTDESMILHLEAISSILNSPGCLGIRLRYFNIAMTIEEQASFVENYEQKIDQLLLLKGQLEDLIALIRNGNGVSIPTDELERFEETLRRVAGPDIFSVDRALRFFSGEAHVRDLKVPLAELQEFQRILNDIVELPGPYIGMSNALATLGVRNPKVSDLRPPLSELLEYEKTLERILEKKKLLDS